MIFETDTETDTDPDALYSEIIKFHPEGIDMS